MCRWSGPWPRAYSSHFNMILLKFQALPAPPPSPTMSPPSSAESPPQWGRVTENLRNCVPPSPPHKRVKSPPLRGGSMGGICPPCAISQWRGLLPVWGGSPPLPGGLYNPSLAHYHWDRHGTSHRDIMPTRDRLGGRISDGERVVIFAFGDNRKGHAKKGYSKNICLLSAWHPAN